MREEPFGDEGNIEVSGNGHEASPSEVTHAEHLPNEGRATTLSIAAKPSDTQLFGSGGERVGVS